MQTKYEQITELRETALDISRLEANIQRNLLEIDNLNKYNTHGENTHVIEIEEGIKDAKISKLIKLKKSFDSQLANIKPYYQ